MTPDQVKAAMMMTATKSNFPDQQHGGGSDDGNQLHQLLRYFHRRRGRSGYGGIQQDDCGSAGGPSAKSPTAVYNQLTGKVTLSGVSGVSTVWGSRRVGIEHGVGIEHRVGIECDFEFEHGLGFQYG